MKNDTVGDIKAKNLYKILNMNGGGERDLQSCRGCENVILHAL